MVFMRIKSQSTHFTPIQNRSSSSKIQWDGKVFHPIILIDKCSKVYRKMIVFTVEENLGRNEFGLELL